LETKQLGSFKTVTTVTTSVEVKIFDTVVAATVRRDTIVDRTNDSRLSHTKHSEDEKTIFLPLSYYEFKMAESPEDASWVESVPYNECLVVIPPERLNLYRTGMIGLAMESPKTHPSPPFQLLALGEEEFFVLDRLQYQGLFFKASGEPVLRRFAFGYFDDITKADYKLTKLSEHLKGRRDCFDVQIEDVSPGRVDEFNCGKFLSFSFLPDEEMMKRLADLKADPLCEETNIIKEFLGIERFRRTEEDD
jgi:hypothetical protein